VAVHQDRYDAVLGEAPADLERGIQRVADLNRVGTDEIANFAPKPIHGGIGLRHRDDRNRTFDDAMQKDAAGLPVTVVAADEDDTAACRSRSTKSCESAGV
jgi:hypothetical protein